MTHSHIFQKIFLGFFEKHVIAFTHNHKIFIFSYVHSSLLKKENKFFTPFFQIPGQRHRCFVCAPNTRKYSDFQELKKMFGDAKIPKCSHYHNSRRYEYIQECPKESKGCLTQFEGILKPSDFIAI